MAQRRTPTPNSMLIIDGPNDIASTGLRKGSSSSVKRFIRRENSSSSLEILPPEEENDKEGKSRSISKKSSEPDYGGSRPGSSAKRAPPVRQDSGSRRPTTPGTPTRQVTLQAVRRKENKSEGDLGPLHWTGHHENAGSSENKDVGDSDEFDTDLEDGEKAAQEEEEEEEIHAPNELKLEFLDCIYKQEWATAKNLCRMILIYEPENPEAQRFTSLIEEKLRIEADPADSDSEDDDDSDESDSDNSDEDSDDSEDDEVEHFLRNKARRKSRRQKKKSTPESTDDEYEGEDEGEDDGAKRQLTPKPAPSQAH